MSLSELLSAAKRNGSSATLTLHARSKPSADMKSFLTSLDGPIVCAEGDIPSNRLQTPREWESFELRSPLELIVESLIHPTTTPSCEEFVTKVTEIISQKGGPCLAYWETRVICQQTITLQYWDALKLLLNAKMVTCSLMPDLIATLIEQNQDELLMLCLEKIEDIREGQIVEILKWAVKRNRDESAGSDQLRSVFQNPDKLNCRWKSMRAFFNTLISYPTTEVFLQKALRTLDEEATKLLFLHLFGWMHIYSVHLVIPEVYKSYCRFPSYAQVISWATILIDAKLLVLVQLPQAEKVFKVMTGLCNSEMNLSRELDRNLYRLTNGTKSKRGDPMGQKMYSIERIQL
eukprot:TRINITY_DN18776_c0_g1_i1.p1 TRINITY_DN18776_c0_g1~~TRINITY_DN18776_c0_g1_i1.p1  ORF type:complete len:347 (+),score=53.40 TRINITY_DN18776_c0_g1_i1:45-1085(+)